jgi:hypothetical protein
MEIMNDAEATKDNHSFMLQRLKLSIGEYTSEGFDVELSYEDSSGVVYPVIDITPTTDGIVISYKYTYKGMVSLDSTKDLVIRFDKFDSYEEFEAYFKKHISLFVSKKIDY